MLLSNDIDIVLTGFMSVEQRAFTLFNVTLELQRLGHDVRHNDIKQQILNATKAMLDRYGYEMVQVIGPKGSVRLYQPIGHDPEEFDFSGYSNSTKCVKGYDSRDRLTIPTNVVQQLFDRNQKVTVEAKDNELVISHQTHIDNGWNTVNNYTIEDSGVLRVAGFLVRAAFGDLVPVRFTINHERQTLHVTEDDYV